MMSELPQLTDAAILAARGPRDAIDPTRPYACFVEPEATPAGPVEDVATVLVTGRECPFRCLVCDLWRHTSEDTTGSTTVTEQIEWALSRLPHTRTIKIYNAGSFFDTRAIPASERVRIAELVRGREALIVECHPRLVGRACTEFASAIAPTRLEVAMGLETIDPAVLPLLNKSITLDDFDRATRFLLENGIAVRAFILLGPPGHRGEQAVLWAERSLDHAFSLGVECCVVIPVRPGNGIVDQLEQRGLFVRPTLSQLESVFRYGLESESGPAGRRVFADLWDIEVFFTCPHCSRAREAALRSMNLTQRPAAPVACHCDDGPEAPRMRSS